MRSSGENVIEICHNKQEAKSSSVADIKEYDSLARAMTAQVNQVGAINNHNYQTSTNN